MTSRSARRTGRIVSGSKDAFSARQPEVVKMSSLWLRSDPGSCDPNTASLCTLANKIPIYNTNVPSMPLVTCLLPVQSAVEHGRIESRASRDPGGSSEQVYRVTVEHEPQV